MNLDEFRNLANWNKNNANDEIESDGLVLQKNVKSKNRKQPKKIRLFSSIKKVNKLRKRFIFLGILIPIIIFFIIIIMAFNQMNSVQKYLISSQLKKFSPKYINNLKSDYDKDLAKLAVSNAKPNNQVMGIAPEREAIIAEAKRITTLGSQGKARYSQDYRGQVRNGIWYLDCSYFTKQCYSVAFSGYDLGGYTGAQLDKVIADGGQIIQIKHPLFGVANLDALGAKPGDLVFRSLTRIPGGANHVAIYGGDNIIYEAATSHAPVTKQVLQSTLRRSFGYLVKPKKIIDADLAYEERFKSGTGVDSDSASNFDINSLPSDVKKSVTNVVTWSSTTLQRMNQYNYKDSILRYAKTFGLDPYYVLAIISIESNGDPYCSISGTYKGLMQVDTSRNSYIPFGIDKSSKALSNPDYNIRWGSYGLKDKYDSIEGLIGFCNSMYAAYGYNAGQLTVALAVSKYMYDHNGKYKSLSECAQYLSNQPMVVAEYIRKVVADHKVSGEKPYAKGFYSRKSMQTYAKGWSEWEKYTYAVKVLAVYQSFKDKKVLN